MKRIIIFAIVGLVMFGVGFGGGLMLGRSLAPSDDTGGINRNVPTPGPTVSIGEFTSNLAGGGRHVISFTLSLELINNDGAVALVQTPAWLVRIRNEVFLTAKDRVYDDLTSAEGTLQFAAEIKRNLNAILPDVNGEPPVERVYFENIILQ